MFKAIRWFAAGLLAASAAVAIPAHAEQRIALVVGNSAYERGAVRTAVADAGLVAEALNGVGFEILEGADLNQADLRRTLRDFLGRVEAAGPDAIAFVYFAGYGLEFEGETYLVPTDARLARDSDIPIEAVRISDLIRPLSGTAGLAKVVVLDASRPLPFTLPLAPGLAPTEAPPGMLIAYSSSPGTYAEDGNEPYGAYAAALAEMLREPGLDIDAMFTQVRVRTHEVTAARQTPWHVASLPPDISLGPDESPSDTAPSVTAPQGGAARQGVAAAPPPRAVRRQPRPMRELDPEEAYGLAIETDTLPGYVEYVETYPDSPYAPRMWSVIRSRREAMAWMRARDMDSREAYWTYISRYPDGIYAGDARRRLRRLAAMMDPPRGFAPVEFYDVPPRLAREPRDHVRVYAPVQRLPRNLIKPRPAFFSALPPPSVPRGPKLLPGPAGLPGSRTGTPPRRFGPPVGVVTPGTEQGTPRGSGDRRFGTGTPPDTIQRDGSPSGRPGVKPLPSATTTTTTPAGRVNPTTSPVGVKPIPTGRDNIPAVRSNTTTIPVQGLKPIPTGRDNIPAVRSNTTTTPVQGLKPIPTGRDNIPAVRVNPTISPVQGLKPIPTGRESLPAARVTTQPPTAPVVRSAPPVAPVAPRVFAPQQPLVQRPVTAPAVTQGRQQLQQQQQQQQTQTPNKRCPIVNGQPKCS